MLALRDLREPERVFQPIVEDLRSEFRPLRALETPPNNLPRRVTSFVGRGRDVIAIVRRIESEALLTIVGAGGMGKTRLALEVAAATLNDRAGGTWFVDLAALSDESLVPNAVAAVLGVELPQDASPLDALAAHLAVRELLLVLDNCEHVITTAAPLVAALLARCPHLTVLATSRTPLDVGGEYVYRLATLDRESAIRLFNDRARAADRSYDPEPYADALEEIVRRLDGIALAIELAAARVRTMPLPSLARHLELRLLAGGRDRLARQQTMQALIDWSYDLLSESERIALRYCAVCSGGFNLREGAMIAGTESRGEAEILDDLSSLVEKSLAIAEGRGEEPRYRLLEPIREYALQRLGEGSEREAARRSHARAFADFAAESFAQWDTDPPADWLGRNERELGNFRAALDFADGGGDSRLLVGLAGDTAPVFLRLALLSEGIAWCERALERDAPAGAVVRLHYGLSMLYNNSGASRRAFEEALEAVRLARDGGDARALARALSQLAHRYSARRRFEEANAVAREALEIAGTLRDRRLLADVLRRCAPAFVNLGMERVRATYAQSVELFRALGRNEETARALMWWGQSEAGAGEYAQAARLLIEAQALVSSDEDGLAGEIAACYLAMGEPANAQPYAIEAFDAARRVRNPILLAFALSNLAVIDAGGAPDEAARLVGYADERLRAAGWKRVAYDAALVQSLKDALAARLGDRSSRSLPKARPPTKLRSLPSRKTCLIAGASTNGGKPLLPSNA